MRYRFNPLSPNDLERLFPFRPDNRRPDGFWNAQDATRDNVKGTSVDPYGPVWPRWRTTPPLHGEGEFVSHEPFFDIDEISQKAEFYPPGSPLVDQNVDGHPASRQRVNGSEAGNLWRRRLLVGLDGSSALEHSVTANPPQSALWSVNSVERTGSSYPEMRLAAAQPPTVAPRAQGQVPGTTDLAPENLEYGAFVARAINQALKEAGVPDTHYNDPDILAAAWDIAARPLANLFSTEVGARIFKVGDKWAVGPAFSNGRDCATGRCGVTVGQAPFIAGLRAPDAGDIHTHPDNRGFSNEDLNSAYIKSRAGQDPWISYIGQENGEVYSVDQNRVRRRVK